MHETNGAAKCIENLNGMVLHGRAIRVDYSATNKAHAPTPGEYRGEKRPFDDRFYRGNDRYRAGERGDRYEDRRGGAFDRGDRWSGDRGGDRADRGGGSWRDR
jgi:transformer-2 protein